MLDIKKIPDPPTSPSLISLKPVLNWTNICFANLFGVFGEPEKKFGELSSFLIGRTFTSRSEPVWPSGKALGWSAEGPRFSPLRLSFLLKIGGLWTLFCDFAHTINEMLKRLTQLPTLMQNHSGGDSVTSRC